MECVNFTHIAEPYKELNCNKYSDWSFPCLFGGICRSLWHIPWLPSWCTSRFEASHASTCYFFMFSSSIVEHIKESKHGYQFVMHRSQKQCKIKGKWMKECPIPWMGCEVLPEKKQNNALGHDTSSTGSRPYISAFFSICWLTCKGEYSP